MNAALSSLQQQAQQLSESVTRPIPGSRKIHVQGSRSDLQVPMREIVLTRTPTLFGGEENAPVTVYDTSGPYTDPQARIDLSVGLPALRAAVNDWAATHRQQLGIAGTSVVQISVRVLIGMVLGAMIALYDELPLPKMGPLAQELIGRTSRLATAFRQVVFAQVKISLLNTLFTAIFLLVVLPLFGVHVPLSKTLVLITFLAGLLPVVGNIISNTVITIVALSVSFYVAMAALLYLVVIHKLEYFLNARIVGGEIQARAWELLLAMLVMEAAFGLPGLVAAPVFYAYIKRELLDQRWI